MRSGDADKPDDLITLRGMSKVRNGVRYEVGAGSAYNINTLENKEDLWTN